MKRISLKKMSPAKRVSVIGLGIALYVTFSLVVQVPFFENYYLCLGYVALATYCYLFGSVAGALVGTVGCVLHALVINGLRGMPGWALGNLFIGVCLGMLFKMTLHNGRSIPWVVLNVIGLILITAVGILGVKSLVEVILYGQPMWARILKNMNAFIADCVVLVLSIPLLFMSERIAKSVFKESAAG